MAWWEEKRNLPLSIYSSASQSASPLPTVNRTLFLFLFRNPNIYIHLAEMKKKEKEEREFLVEFSYLLNSIIPPTPDLFWLRTNKTIPIHFLLPGKEEPTRTPSWTILKYYAAKETGTTNFGLDPPRNTVSCIWKPQRDVHDILSLTNSNPRDRELGLLFFREGNPKHYEIKRAENESNKLYVKRMVETSAQTSFSPRMHHGKISRRYSDAAYPTTKIRANGVGFWKSLPKITSINISKWDSNEVHIVIVIKRKICKHSLWESGLSDFKLLEKDLCDRLIISPFFFKVSRQGCLDRNRTSIPPSSDSMQQWGRPVYTLFDNSISSCRTPILSQQFQIDMRSWTQGAPMFWAEALMRAIIIRW